MLNGHVLQVFMLQEILMLKQEKKHAHLVLQITIVKEQIAPWNFVCQVIIALLKPTDPQNILAQLELINLITVKIQNKVARYVLLPIIVLKEQLIQFFALQAQSATILA